LARRAGTGGPLPAIAEAEVIPEAAVTPEAGVTAEAAVTARLEVPHVGEDRAGEPAPGPVFAADATREVRV
jgi:hypothetical protein